MKHVCLSEARANIATLLDEVERGETLVIAPERLIGSQRTPEEQARIKAAVERIRELRKGNGPVTTEEILAWRDEGRRF